MLQYFQFEIKVAFTCCIQFLLQNRSLMNYKVISLGDCLYLKLLPFSKKKTEHLKMLFFCFGFRLNSKFGNTGLDLANALEHSQFCTI